MRYENFDGTIEELVRIKIKEIEEKENIRVLHVIESGSRAWGFASPDSDYDVRFIYVRNKEYYLSLRDNKDFIDWELNEILDINGWDIRKALQLFINPMRHYLSGVILRLYITQRMNGREYMKVLQANTFPANRLCIIIMVLLIKIIMSI